jgi:catechol 2,3-dioxygenase-like lactoylglutathione lyase family enzyme
VTPTLTHVAIHAKDLTRCVSFYQRYCAMSVCHDREDPHSHVVWLAEPGRESEFILVIIDGGPGTPQADDDFGHLGFAVESRDRVEEIAAQAERDGCLVWPPRQESYPVGYYCGIRDPNGRVVEFSFGQPLGPGAPAHEDDRGSIEG